VPGAAPEEAVRFTDTDAGTLVAVVDFAVAGGAVLATATFILAEGAVVEFLLRRDLAGGPQNVEPLRFIPQRLVGVPGRDLVVAEAAGDLWLLAVH
jgi:hypothetical protein